MNGKRQQKEAQTKPVGQRLLSSNEYPVAVQPFKKPVVGRIL